jgi:hypothetical protein
METKYVVDKKVGEGAFGGDNNIGSLTSCRGLFGT